MRSRLLLALPLLLAACATGTPAAAPARQSAAVVTVAARPSKVLLVVLENHGVTSALAGLPRLAAQAGEHGRAGAWQAAAHPSLPNYLALAGGSTFGVVDDAGPQQHPLSGASVFGQAVSHGRTARTYAEGMTGTCSVTGTERYAVRHNPWTYFTDPAERAACRIGDVPSGTTTAGALHDDVATGALPTVGMLVPDLCHDAHDCPLAAADAWLADWLRVVQAGPDYRAGRLAVVVTFDEDEGGEGPNDVLTVVIAPRTTRVVSGLPFSHRSFTRYAGELSGATPLRQAASARSILEAFRV